MNILVLLKLADDQCKELEAVLPSANYVYTGYSDVTKDMVQNADVILGSVPKDFVSGAKNLKWLQLSSAGSDHVQKIFPKNAVLTNASGSYGEAMAEFMLAQLLFIQKNLHICHINQQKNLWTNVSPGKSILGSTTLVLGLGDIGGAFAKRMKALGSYVIGLRRKDKSPDENAHEIHLTEALDSLLPRADILALALPATSETYQIMSKDRINKLKQHVIVVNVGRGQAIDTEAICDALYSGKIGGAALDVTDPEPLPADHRLWQAPNCLITPHISGQDGEKHTYQKIISLAIQNFKAFVNKTQMQNVVDFDRGY